MALKRLTLRIDRPIVYAMWCTVLLAASGSAATLTVKPAGGGNYTTIQACANAMSNGDACVVYAGTYNESVTISAGGVGAYRTLQVNGSDLVTVTGTMTLASHTKIVGFTFQPTSPTTAACLSVPGGTTDYYITNNTATGCGGFNWSSSAASTHGFIQGNTISYSCTSSTANPIATCHGMEPFGDYNLFENNDISHVSDAFRNFTGRHNVFRNNHFHDAYENECVVGASAVTECHIDYIEDEPNVVSGVPSQYNLYERNTETNIIGPNSHGFLLQADGCSGQCYNTIIRFNIGAHVGGGAIVDDNAHNQSTPGFSHVSSYNNTWVDYVNDPGNQPFGIQNQFNYGSTYGSNINDIFYYPEALTDFNAYATDTNSQPFTARNNLVYCTPGPCNIRASTYGIGRILDDVGNVLGLNPNFTNYAGNDFSLAAGSPAIAAGAYLTAVASADSGSGTALVVNDADYFQDGSGIAGVNGDCVSIGSATNHFCITAVNYATNTLTLSSAITRSAGDRVWLYSDSTGRQVLFGSAPNIGATFSSAPVLQTPLAPPTVSAVAH